MRKSWAAFWLLGLIWGSSFLLIRIGVEEIPAFELVFIRVGIAAVGLNVVLWLRGKRLPTDWKTTRSLMVIGIGNTAIPFTLISLGEKSIDSGIAAVLQATAALFTLVIAHLAFADERMTPQKVGGLVVGFLGVVLLASRSWQDGQVVTGSLLGQLAIVAASLFYATFSSYSRRVMGGKVEPLALSAGAMIWATLTMGALMLIGPLFGQAAILMPGAMSRGALAAALLLGLLNTFIAYLLYYSIIKNLGASRASMVTYIIPPVGLTLGVILRDELLDVRLVVGALLILGGIAVVNLRWRWSWRRVAAAAHGAGD